MKSNMIANQCSDNAQGGGASGTKTTSVTPRKYTGVVDDPSPATKNPSGSSQSDSRGKQG
jgi:hypothetical protein